jgi:predicted transcriptional regulator
VKEMKLVKDEKLKSYIYVSIMKLSLSESIEVTDEELKYLNQNLALLNNIGYVTGKSAQKTKTTFINRSRDYIGMLEQMKKDFEIY